MKGKFGNFILFIIMIVLMGGLVFFGWIFYKVVFQDNKVSTVHTGDSLMSVEPSKEVTEKTQKTDIATTLKELLNSTPTPTPVNYSTNQSQGKYYYDQLSDTQKKIYDGLQASKAKMISGTYTIEFGDKFSDVLGQENGGDILGDDYQTAIEAFTHDNPDLFYIDVSKMYLNMETNKRAFSTTYNVYIGPKEGQNYFAKGFASETEVRIALDKIETAKKNITAKFTGDTYKDIKLIHDYLVENVEYDENYSSIGAYTIYGVLVDRKAVCEGYSRAFKYLADAAGIENILMQGNATNSTGEQEKHAWNAVKLKWEWYLIDATWDDPIIVGTGIVATNTHYKYFLKGSKTFYKDHQPEYQFSDNGKIFTYPTISLTDY